MVNLQNFKKNKHFLIKVIKKQKQLNLNLYSYLVIEVILYYIRIIY